MTLDLFLSPADGARVSRVLQKLALHDIERFALTGGLALELHLIDRGHAPCLRTLNDIDFVVDSFASIPGTLGKDFLIRHIHPRVPEGKTLMQLVDPDEALRIDIFRAYGATMKRCCFTAGQRQIVSAEDLAARAASLLMDLQRRLAVAAKYAENFQRLVNVIDLDRIEAVWRDHRKPSDPLTFQETSIRIEELVQSHANLLVTLECSQDADAICPKCEETGPFRLASPQTILSLLGYC